WTRVHLLRSPDSASFVVKLSSSNSTIISEVVPGGKTSFPRLAVISIRLGNEPDSNRYFTASTVSKSSGLTSSEGVKTVTHPSREKLSRNGSVSDDSSGFHMPMMLKGHVSLSLELL